jgi:hypothetical protein
LAGCQVPIDDGPGAGRVTLVGAARDGLINGVSIRRTIDTLQVVETDGVMAFDAVKLPNQNYDVILGANKKDANNASGHFHESSLTFYLDYGWVYLYGQGPMAETGRVSAQAQGSSMIVQIDNDDDVHRVFFMQGTSATVKWRANPTNFVTLAVDEYVEADAAGTLTVHNKPYAADIVAFLAYVEDQVGPFR